MAIPRNALDAPASQSFGVAARRRKSGTIARRAMVGSVTLHPHLSVEEKARLSTRENGNLGDGAGSWGRGSSIATAGMLATD